MKDVWYLHIEGVGAVRDDVPYRFGFIVECVVVTSSKRKARQLVCAALEKDRMRCDRARMGGRFQDFDWDSKQLERKMQKLAEAACVLPEVPMFADFHTWPLMKAYGT